MSIVRRSREGAIISGVFCSSVSLTMRFRRTPLIPGGSDSGPIGGIGIPGLLEDPSQELIKRLRRGNPNDFLFPIPQVQVQMGSKLDRRERIDRVHAEVIIGPRRPHRIVQRVPEKLNASANPQAVGQARQQSRPDIQVSLTAEGFPVLLAKGCAGHLSPPGAGPRVLLRTKSRAGRPLRNPLPVDQPWALQPPAICRLHLRQIVKRPEPPKESADTLDETMPASHPRSVR